MKKNKKNILVNILFLLVIVNLFAGDGGAVKNIKELDKKDFRIFLNGEDYISLDMGYEEIVNKLGKPLKINVNKNSFSSDNDEISYEYNGFSIYFYRKDAKVNYIYVTDTEYHSQRGIHVGDSIESVNEMYPIDKIFPSGSLLAQYYTEDGTLRVFNIAFETKNSSVTSIILEVASDL